jgi:Tfp pilus assembly protein PilN
MDSIDFLPERIRQQRTRRRRLICKIYLLVACAMALVLLGYLRGTQIKQASAQLATIQENGQSLRKQVLLRKQLEEQMLDLNVKKLVEEHLGSRVSPQLVLAELQKLLPEGIGLTKMELTAQEIPADKRALAKPVGVNDKPDTQGQKRLRMLIVGLAPSDVDLANFIAQLSTSPLFENVNMVYSKSVVIQGHVAQEFSATCLVAK